MKGFTARNNFNDELSDMNISMEEESHCSESVTLSSPPRASRERSGGGSGTGFSTASRLFFDEFDNEDSETKKPTGILRPLDLNLQLSGLTDDTTSSSAVGSRTPHRKTMPVENNVQRKRHAEQQLIGRDLSFDYEDDTDNQESPVEMIQSPRVSPSCYKSPSTYPGAASTATVHKSPCYRTMDGRTIQSKNPFSPMYTEDAAVSSSVGPISESLNFPVSLEEKETFSGDNQRAPFLRHRLQKRDSKFSPSYMNPVAPSMDHYNAFTRDGYPERQGRYSFTGSPIREVEASKERERRSMDIPISHKVRRRTKFEDAAAAASVAPHPAASEYCKIKKQTNLFVDTEPPEDPKSYYRQRDKISPTDVLSFPSMNSPGSPSTPMPPTPTKPKQYRRRPKTKYTPVRKPAVPPTPMPERRSRAFHSDQEVEAMEHERNEPQSRFHSDFDVIDELGNGSFGNVFKVMSRLDGCMYAIKVAHRPAKGNADKDRMLKEVYALAALSDQADAATFHIVRYHQAWMEEQRLYIQTELCTSTLAAEIQHRSPTLMPTERRYKFLREMCLALEFIHKNGMVHLDIKPENIFIKNNQFKLGDFGLVSKVSEHDVEEGDSRYMSMELLSGDHTDLTKSDLFSLGITLYELCLGGLRPLPTNGPEWQNLRAANFMALANTPVEMQHLIKLMMNPNFPARPSAAELLKRPQLLSDEQKALVAERNKVVQANLALAEQANRLKILSPPPVPLPRKGLLVRANTWNGS